MTEPPSAKTESLLAEAGERYARFKRFHYHDPRLGLSLDLSRMRLDEADLGMAAGAVASRLEQALGQMGELEAGAIANPDEGRQVGHYWLRAPELAPSPSIRGEIENTVAEVEELAGGVHNGGIAPERAERFEHLVVVGIGGSALGPQMIGHALGSASDPLRVHFLDNTDPDGVDRLLDELGETLAAALCVVISKSGGTKETRNGMLELERAYRRMGLRFGPHAMAVTGRSSALDAFARDAGFITRVPMWNWVGGRTSVTCAVGLLPAALQGLDIRGLLDGARLMDETTRRPEVRANPAALLAAAWYGAGKGRGEKDMVVIPYKDRLQLLSRYLQQLVMESLGKGLDLDGERVEQGIAVYGNKGSTDQHAYLQQLLDGLDNAFVTLIEVLRDRPPGREAIEVEPGVTTGDYLSGFLQGTRQALSEKGRESLTLTVAEVDARSVGALIALYERAVGLYASLVNINAYHQPAVEAGKRAASEVLELQRQLVKALRARPGQALSVEQLACEIESDDVEAVFWVMRHLGANPDRGVRRVVADEASLWEARFEWAGAEREEPVEG